MSHGVQSLSDLELLAAIFGRGIQGRNVFEISRHALELIDSCKQNLRLEELEALRGVGRAKAAQLVAAQEFFRRRISPRGIRLEQPQDLMPYIQQYMAKRQEHFLVASVNGAQELLNIQLVGIGSGNQVHISPRDIFQEALIERASAIILIHTHPDGDEQPTDEDRRLTRHLKRSGALLGIQVLDHIIMGRRGYFSFARDGLI